ncbi:sugar kinase [Actinomadura craniellae]|uniref:Sugar kinase n=1 Tax=Actinomadura craniellae TaxID=2231787 RepID=A0A365H0B0_9ACTN|nr:PfkB family carbohydrate kinase [Actinomadura craniellae]RAY12519.1 sugar kinase [Actinomadura craniellae]
MTDAPAGIFIGLCTLDVIQSVDHVPGPDEKITAFRQTVAAGGPAANAAVAFSGLGGTATLLTGVGRHPLAAGIRADLRDGGVDLIDLDPDRDDPPAVSTIMVTAGTGERAVVSTNAGGYALRPPERFARLVGHGSVVQVDGHHPGLAAAGVRTARDLGRPTLLDGGSWKAGTRDLLPYIDVAVCSADFRPPGVTDHREVLRLLREAGVTWAAITRGAEDVLWAGPDGAGRVPVPRTAVVDTLGAGDVFHGALAVELAAGLAAFDFVGALERAAGVAAAACASFGTRDWISPPGTRRSGRSAARRARWR